jgi:hypothetical protein
LSRQRQTDRASQSNTDTAINYAIELKEEDPHFDAIGSWSDHWSLVFKFSSISNVSEVVIYGGTYTLKSDTPHCCLAYHDLSALRINGAELMNMFTATSSAWIHRFDLIPARRSPYLSVRTMDCFIETALMEKVSPFQRRFCNPVRMACNVKHFRFAAFCDHFPALKS